MITVYRAWIQAHMKDERGATMVEYAIMVALIAVIVLGIVFALGGVIKGSFKTTKECIETPGGGTCPP